MRGGKQPLGILGGSLGLILVLALGAAWAGEVPPEGDGEPTPWKDSAELSYVVTGGNASTSAFSLANTLKRGWGKDVLTIRTFILRSNATTTTRQAVGTETDFRVLEQKVVRLVAENYLLATQYDRWIAKRLLAQAQLSWDRNRFAGVASRVTLTAGAGWAMVEAKKTQIKSEAGVTYTVRRYVGQSTTSFAGFRVNLMGSYQPMEKSAVTTQFVFDDNLKNTVDWRFDWINSVSATISKSFALKTSVRFLYSHLPALETLPLLTPAGDPTGLSVRVPLRKLDTFFTTSLVINF
jgi:putative salt-induced outer membrane protein YdiY